MLSVKMHKKSSISEKRSLSYAKMPPSLLFRKYNLKPRRFKPSGFTFIGWGAKPPLEDKPIVSQQFNQAFLVFLFFLIPPDCSISSNKSG